MRGLSCLIAACSMLLAPLAAAQTASVYAALPGTAWVIIEWNGAEPNTPMTPQVAFHGGFRFGGRAGCNAYAGSYRVSGERIAFDPSAWTKMLCPEERTAIDEKIGADWRRVRRMMFDADGVLAALAEDGTAIFRFRRAAPSERD
jgi:heat shock protein HslJ